MPKFFVVIMHYSKVRTKIQTLVRRHAAPSIVRYRVKAQNFGSDLNIGNGPQSGPSVYNGAKGRKAAH